MTLPTIVQKDATPATPEEATEIAECYMQPNKRLYAAAARLYEIALKDTKSVALNHHVPARAAALAGCGVGEDAASLNVTERSRLRGRALAWLRADFEECMGEDPRWSGGSVRLRLARWLCDPDLACVRDEKELAKLPAAEREGWAKLWGDVTALRKKLAEKP